MRPQPGDYTPYFETYISLVKAENILSAFESNFTSTLSFIESIPEAKADFSYAPGKWSVKQVIIHIADCERVFNYRELSIARGDEVPLPGFNENVYADNCAPEKRTISDVAVEFSLVRQNTIYLFKTFDETMLSRRGVSNNNPVTVLALGFVTAGHEIHHLNVLRDRYKL